MEGSFRNKDRTKKLFIRKSSLLSKKGKKILATTPTGKKTSPGTSLTGCVVGGGGVCGSYIAIPSGAG